MPKEKFILVSLKEQESKKLAQIVSNDTARRILDYLAEKEATETELAEKLNIPISTVHYNLQALVKGKLVEADEYHYSEKGKEVIHYKLANKFIIIAPKSTFGFKEKLRSILPVALFIGAAAGFIHFISRKFIPKIPMAAIPRAAESMAKGGGAPFAAVSNQTLDIAVEEAEAVMAEVPVQEAVPEIVNETIEYIIEAVPKQHLWTSVALWFLIGAVSALVIYFIIDYLRNKKNK